ncbi:MAG: DUF5107 domain-containing protein, partial [bacterium]
MGLIMTRLRQDSYAIEAAALEAENPLPAFRAPEPDRAVPCAESLPAEERTGLGWAAGTRVLPYRMQDAYTRLRRPVRLPALILENERLRATFLPGLGAKLASLVDLDTGRELLERNPVL